MAPERRTATQRVIIARDGVMDALSKGEWLPLLADSGPQMSQCRMKLSLNRDNQHRPVIDDGVREACGADHFIEGHDELGMLELYVEPWIGLLSEVHAHFHADHTTEHLKDVSHRDVL